MVPCLKYCQISYFRVDALLPRQSAYLCQFDSMVREFSSRDLHFVELPIPVPVHVMLRNVLVMSMSGLALFSKEFVQAVSQVCAEKARENSSRSRVSLGH